jgi:anti-sigma factor RsiW
MSCEHRDDAGAWVLGALAEDERERFAAHLASCEICRREVAELQMVADTLPLAAVQVAPPPELKDRIVSAVRAEADVLAATGPEADVAATRAEAGEPAAPASAPPATPVDRRPPGKHRRERSWWKRPFLSLGPLPAAAAAAVLIALGVAGGVLLSNGPSERTVQAQVVTPSAPAARASLTVSGEEATLNVRNFPAPPRGRVYQVWLKRSGRNPAPTDALFDVRDGSATVEVPGGVKGVDQVLVTDEPDGGSRAPTRAPVVIAQPA